MKIEDFTSNAPGNLVRIAGEPDSIRAFVPHPLPRDLSLSSKISRLNEEAGMVIGQIRATGDVLNPSVELYLRKEALASNKIEGTIATAKDLYLLEASEAEQVLSSSRHDTQEVLNYVHTMREGVRLLGERPLSTNLILELHSMLLANVRGQSKTPGRLRQHQNAIAMPSKPTLEAARFVPPPAEFVQEAMNNLESFIHEESNLPDLVRAALFHYQFETIHPFGDGNGRTGRLLVPLLLIQWGKLPVTLPKFYLSPNLAEKDREYRDKLLRVSQTGDWLGWIEFFLGVVIDEGKRACQKSEELKKLKDDYLSRVLDCPGRLRAVIDHLFVRPVIRLKNIEEEAKVSPATAVNYAKKLVDRKILIADTSEYRHYYFAPHVFSVFFDEFI